ARARPLTPTSSPYTTLFRSNRPGWLAGPAGRGPGGGAAAGGPGQAGQAGPGGDVVRHPQGGRGGPAFAEKNRAPGRRLERHARQDRKSTRLNSSHLGISYAV